MERKELENVIMYMWNVLKLQGVGTRHKSGEEKIRLWKRWWSGWIEEMKEGEKEEQKRKRDEEKGNNFFGEKIEQGKRKV